MENFAPFLPFAVVAAAPLIVMWIVSYRKKILRGFAAGVLPGQRYEEVSLGKVLGFPVYPSLRIYHGGTTLYINSSAANKNSPPYTRLYAEAAPPFSLRVSKEGFLTGIGKKLRFGKEIEVGIPDLDDHYYIQTEDPHLAKQFLQNPRCGEILRDLKNDPSFSTLAVFQQTRGMSGSAWSSPEWRATGRTGGSVFLSRTKDLKYWSSDRTLLSRYIDHVIELSEIVSQT